MGKGAPADVEAPVVSSRVLDSIKDAITTVAGLIKDSVSIEGIMPEGGLPKSWVTKLGLGEEETRFVDPRREQLFAEYTDGRTGRGRFVP